MYKRSAPLAQLVEQETFNLKVVGSTPTGRTILFALEKEPS